MRSSARPQSRAVNQRFIVTLVGSSLIHAAGLGAAVFAQARAPRPPALADAIPVQLVRLGKPRDPKLLPRKVAPPPPGPRSAAPPTPRSAVPIEGDGTQDREPSLSKAAERLLASGSELTLDEAVERLEEAEGSPLGAPEGTTTSGEIDPYTMEVTRRLQAAYTIPVTVPAAQRPFLFAEVILYLNRDGSVRSFSFTERHQNEQFMRALEAMLKTVKLPAPPRERVKELTREGLPVRFRP